MPELPLPDLLPYTPSRPIEAFHAQPAQQDIALPNSLAEQSSSESQPMIDLHQSYIEHVAPDVTQLLPERQIIVHATEAPVDTISRMLETMVVIKHAA